MIQDYFGGFPVAYNPDTGELVRDATFQVFAPDDLAFATPLAITDPASGAPISSLQSTSDGVLRDFRVAGDLPQVVIKSGAFVTKLTSLYGALRDAGFDPAEVAAAVAAVPVAEAARDAALVAQATAEARVTQPTTRTRLTARQAHREMLVRIVNTANKFFLNTWLPSYLPGTDPITVLPSLDPAAIRRPPAAALSLATAIGLGVHDTSLTGKTITEATAATTRIIDAWAGLHKANGGTWGGAQDTPPPVSNSADGWMDAMWAWQTAQAASLIWGSLSATTQRNVQLMIIWEANRMINWTIPFWKNRAGSENYAGDSQAESIGWDAAALVTALAMRPGHVNGPKWRRKLAECGLALAAVPADLTDTTPVNGIVPATFLNGTNANPDGTIINHGLVHPAYSFSHVLPFGALTLAAQKAVPMPVALLRNTALVWSGYTQVVFDSPPYFPPGGTMYVPGSQTIYYPEGSDYGTTRIVELGVHDIFAGYFNWDEGLNTDADEWALLHLQQQLDLQARNATGQTYQAGEDTLAGVEQQAASIAALGLLALSMPQPVWDTSTIPVPPASPWQDAVKSILTPTLWLPLADGSALTYTDSAGGHDATVSGTVTQAASIIPGDPGGKSAVFGGRLFVPFGSWMNGAVFTVAVSMKASASSLTEALVSRSGGTGTNPNVWHIVTQPTTGHARAVGFANNTANVAIEGTTNIRDGNPHLVVLVSTGTQITLYVDGVQEATAACNLRTDGDCELSVARRNSANFPYVGTLDDVVLKVGTALNSTQVGALYTAWNTP